MADLAAHLGLNFQETDSTGLIVQLKNFQLFRREKGWFSNGKITNVLRETVGQTEVFLFDYTYKISTGKSAKIVKQTVFFAQNRSWSLPSFELRPETWWHKLKEKFGYRDIDFPDAPDFSEKFWLTGQFEEHIRAQFHPEIRDFLTQRPPGHLEGENFYLISYKPGKELPPDEARTFFNQSKNLVAMLSRGEQIELLSLVKLREKVLVN